MPAPLRNLRQLVRSLARRPGFTVTVVLSLALGVAAASTVIRVVDRLLLHPLTVQNLDELVDLRLHWAREGEDDALSYPAYRHYADSGALASLTVFAGAPATLRGGGVVEPLDGQLVSPGYFRLLGVDLAQGRGFADDEGDAPLVVVSWDLWHRTFGADPELVGRAIELNDHPYTVVGVAPRGFRGLRLADPKDFWVPVENLPRIATGFMAQIPVLELEGVRWLDAVGRLPPGTSPDAAAEQLTRLARDVETSQSRDVSQLRAELTPLAVAALDAEARQQIEGFLGLLAALVALELLITASNLGGLFFARALEGRRTAAIRFSLGAPRGSVSRRLVAEGLLLSALGTAAGLGVAQLLLRWMGSLRLPGLPALGADALTLSPAHLTVIAALALTGGLALLLPVAWKAGRLRLVDALKDTEPRSGGPRRDLRRALLTAQVALALVLLTGTALFVRSLHNAWSDDPGFSTRDVVETTVNLGIYGYDEARARNFYASLAERLAADPSVAAVSWASDRPLGQGRIEMGFALPGRQRSDDEELKAPALVVSPGFFASLGIPLTEGRRFAEADRGGAPAVAVVSRAFAERYWPGQRAVGQTLRVGGDEGTSLEVVGVVADVKLNDLEEEPRPVLYLPLAQNFGLVGLRTMHLLVRTTAPPSRVVPTVRRAIEILDPALRVDRIGTLQSSIRQRFVPQQLGAAVLGFLAFFALLLAAVGIYGLLASFVVQHTREIGLRMALGADRRSVGALVALRLLAPVLVGLLAGAVLAVLLLRLVTSLLYAVQPADPLTLSAATVLLLLVAAFATYLPARRAVRIPPARALRWE